EAAGPLLSRDLMAALPMFAADGLPELLLDISRRLTTRQSDGLRDATLGCSLANTITRLLCVEAAHPTSVIDLTIHYGISVLATHPAFIFAAPLGALDLLVDMQHASVAESHVTFHYRGTRLENRVVVDVEAAIRNAFLSFVSCLALAVRQQRAAAFDDAVR